MIEPLVDGAIIREVEGSIGEKMVLWWNACSILASKPSHKAFKFLVCGGRAFQDFDNRSG